MREVGLAFRYGLSLLLLCASVFPSPLHAKSWRVTEFQDSIAIDHAGGARVRERLTIQFEGEWHGIHRTIPIEYPGPHGTNYTLLLKVLSVADGTGNELKYESNTSKGFRDLKIYIPGATDTTKVVQIDYAVKNGIRYFDSYDEFYLECHGERLACAYRPCLSIRSLSGRRCRFAAGTIVHWSVWLGGTRSNR